MLFANSLPLGAEPQEIALYFGRIMSIHPANVTYVVHDADTPEGMCGWSLVKRVFDRFRIPIPEVAMPLVDALSKSQFGQTITSILDNANAAWADSTEDVSLRKLAYAVRNTFLHRILHKPGPPDYLSAGTTDAHDVTMQPTANVGPVDPLTVNDPWAKAQHQASRWEDLKLPSVHPFVDTAQKPVPQIHRLQASKNRGGVILAPKGSVADVLKTQPPAPSIVVMSAGDSSSYGPLAARIQGPFEVVLEDPKLKTSHKRLVQFLLVEGDVKFSLAKPTCSFTTPLVSELVLELDSRCTDKSLFTAIQQAPLMHFREKALEVFGPKSFEGAQFYGFRTFRNPPGGEGATQLQIIVKVPAKSREQLLSQSAVDGPIFVRDFVERNAQPADTTVLPRFWPVSSVGLHQICATSAGLPGFGGLQITKRGIAVRAWVSALADARKVFMTEDERICPANYATVPRVLFNAAGWPAGVRPADLVDCVQKATKQAPIPTRAFRDSGVHCWTLGFESAPSPTKFTVQINGQLHEILLSPVSPVAPKSKVRNHANKPKPREKSDAKTPAGDIVKVVSNPSSNDSARIDALEKKFDVLEKKQDNFEHKMDRRYDEIADHLRQILQSTNQRPREPTGESPPGKYQKAC